MLPYVHIFSREIPMYGILAGLGILLAVVYLKLAEKRVPSLAADAELMFLYGIIGAFVGAKLLYLATVLSDLKVDLPYLWTETSAFLKKYLNGGFVFFGGLYGALLAAYIYARVTKTSLAKLINVVLPVIPLIHGIGRIGCFCMGCCYGRPSIQWGVLFSQSDIAPRDIPLLPVQMYEAVGELLLFVVLARLGAKGMDGRKMLIIYLFSYGVLRFLLEFLRGDLYRGFLLDLSVSQVISVFSVLFAGTLLIRMEKMKSKSLL